MSEWEQDIIWNQYPHVRKTQANYNQLHLSHLLLITLITTDDDHELRERLNGWKRRLELFVERLLQAHEHEKQQIKRTHELSASGELDRVDRLEIDEAIRNGELDEEVLST